MEEVEDLGKLVIEKNGTEVECEILFTFENEELRKQYVGYTDHSIGENGRKNIYVSAYDPIIGFGKLEDITTHEELEMIQNVLEQIAAE